LRGTLTLRATAGALNADSITTATGAPWLSNTVAKVQRGLTAALATLGLHDDDLHNPGGLRPLAPMSSVGE